MVDGRQLLKTMSTGKIDLGRKEIIREGKAICACDDALNGSADEADLKRGGSAPDRHLCNTLAACR